MDSAELTYISQKFRNLKRLVVQVYGHSDEESNEAIRYILVSQPIVFYGLLGYGRGNKLRFEGIEKDENMRSDISFFLFLGGGKFLKLYTSLGPSHTPCLFF